MVEFNNLPAESKPEPEDIARSRRLAAHWNNLYEKAERDLGAWHKDCADVVKRYRDQRGESSRDISAGRRKFNSLWGWFETIRPAVYSQTPLANVERRFLDRDPIGKTSSQILERALRNEFEINGFESAIKRAVQDYLLPGRGVVWVRYEPQFEESQSIPPVTYVDEQDSLGPIENKPQTEEEEKLESTGEELITESAPLDYIHWHDFKTYPATARTWFEVQAVSKDLFLSKEECVRYFGEEIGNELQAQTEEPQKSGSNDLVRDLHQRIDDKRKIIEIWDKKTEKVYWIAQGYPYLCKEEDDPLKLTNFFPCPEPLSSILTSDTMIPVPFYHEWKDQAEQLDELNNRINVLTKACKAVGIYDGSIKTTLDRIFKESNENMLIPVDGFSAFGEKGLASAIFFVPIEVIAATLDKLNQQFELQLKLLDLLTGVSDIMKGTSDARETLGAQKIKTSAAGTRVEEQRRAVGRFVRDAVRLVAEVIAKHFSEKTLAEASGIFYEEEVPNNLGLFLLEKLTTDIGEDEDLPQMASPPIQPPQAPPGAPPGMPPGQAPQPMGAPGVPQMPPNPQMMLFQKAQKVAIKVKKAIDLIRDDIERGYRIDIEIDTMVAGDQMQERQDATEFIGAVTKFVGEVGQIVMVQPLFAPLAGKMLQWGTRKFRTGRELESAIEEFVDQVTEQAKNPQPKPNPEEIKLQIEQQKGQAEIAKAKLDAQSAQANDQREAQLNQQDMQMEMMKMRAEVQKMQQEMQMREREFQMKLQELQITHSQKLQQGAMQHQQSIQQAMTPQMPLNPGLPQ